MRRLRPAALAVLLASVAAACVPATAGHLAPGRSTEGLTPLGHSRRSGSYATGTAHSDLAFWGNRAYQGNYDGFRIVDISDPASPKELGRKRCHGGQGDVVVWGTLLIRAVDRPQTKARCGGQDTPGTTPGFEGLQIFRVSDPAAPRLLTSVPVDCGAHTMTVVPGPKRLLLYVSSSHPGFFGRSRFGNECRRSHGRIPIVAVPFGRVRQSRVIGSFPIGRGNHCHDIAVHLGIDRALGACWPRANLWDISRPARPALISTFTVPGVEGWHSASWTWDGRLMVLGWEPGGGALPECESDDPAVKRRVFFFRRANGGTLVGWWTLRRFQSSTENCTIHNYNVVPLEDRYVLVSGNYQSGTSVVDFTDPSSPREVAYSDPAPLQPTQIGGAWSSYWYDGAIYESDITRGLNVFGFDDPLVSGAVALGRLNPQTQEVRLRRGG